MKSLDRKHKNIKVFEPEDLPIQSQISKVTLSGGLVLALTVKRIFFRKSSMSRSTLINNLAVVTTIATGYPIFRSGLENLIKRRKLNNDFLIYNYKLNFCRYLCPLGAVFSVLLK